ncbi:hypothetical protein A0H81_05024 [Grifola frondosa]|uniref:Uncharacterized protein n=1 Tax=Grifola frondosa TaxID=5627 RepID=A0A1C7MFF1_GRIFR|nr:hypothetical protein A0H81_05024 [Grifola frondosa]
MAKRARSSRSQDGAAPKAKKPRNKSSTTVRAGELTGAQRATGSAATSMRHDEGTRRVKARLTPACIPMFGDADILASVQNNATTSNHAPAVAHDDVVKPAASEPLTPELQTSSCQSSRYRSDEFPRCVSCIRRKGNDSCRFKGIRFFLRDPDKVVVGTRFKEGQGADSTPMEFPKDWNVPLTMSHVRETKVAVARALLPILKEDLQHLELNAIVHRPRETTVRATCDTCKTSIFSSTFMCRICGREACPDCFDQIKTLSVSLIETKLPSWRPALHVHPFLTCAKDAVHAAADFVPMSRFCKTELQNAITDMQDLLDMVEAESLLVPELKSSTSLTPGINSDTLTSALSRSSTPVEAPTWSISQAAPSETPPSHTTLRFSNDELTDNKFKQVWQKGEAIVVTGLLPRFGLQWTPQYFQEKHGSDRCSIVDPSEAIGS